MLNAGFFSAIRLCAYQSTRRAMQEIGERVALHSHSSSLDPPLQLG